MGQGRVALVLQWPVQLSSGLSGPSRNPLARCGLQWSAVASLGCRSRFFQVPFPWIVLVAFAALLAGAVAGEFAWSEGPPQGQEVLHLDPCQAYLSVFEQPVAGAVCAQGIWRVSELVSHSSTTEREM